MKRWKPIAFLALLLAAFCAIDWAAASWARVENSTLFRKNDYEKTVLTHGGGVTYDKVFFGNSVVVSAYSEARSTSGYVNFGMDYAVVTDLKEMLERGYLAPKEDLVVLLNYLVLLDTFDTDPTYPWHRRGLEPYLWFQRDRIQTFADNAMDALLHRHTLSGIKRYTGLGKEIYTGALTDDELDERIALHSELWWSQDLSNYQENFAALRDVADWCDSHGVRLRVVLAPWNSYIEMPDYPKAALEEATEILTGAGVEVLDWTDAFPRKYFYDLGHFNTQYGALAFTEAIDPWLNS